MKKYVGFCLAMSISTAAVCSEGSDGAQLAPKRSLGSSQEIGLRNSGDKAVFRVSSSDAIKIVATHLKVKATQCKTQQTRENFYEQFSPSNRAFYSSGSNPVGAEHLFPGEMGRGGIADQIKPVPYGVGFSPFEW